MNFKKLGKALLFPHTAIMLMLIPVATVFLVYSMVFLGKDSVTAIVSYVLAFYTLTVWCLRIPRLIDLLNTFKSENKYAKRWWDDKWLRMNMSLYGTLIWNTAYAVFQLGLGFWHRSFWFYSLAGYYISLAVMRFFLVSYTRKHDPREELLEEFRRYRICGIVFLIMNLALTLMIFFMVYWGRTFVHHEITTIALAVYTFTSITLSVVNIVKNRTYGSPVYSASKAISLAAACVSMLTLESTMLTTFGAETVTPIKRKIFLGASGGVISLLVIIMAIYMIVLGTKKIGQIKAKEELTNGKQKR